MGRTSRLFLREVGSSLMTMPGKLRRSKICAEKAVPNIRVEPGKARHLWGTIPGEIC